MARIDFTPYRRSTVGFDHLFDLLESSVRNSGDNYPPFNIEKRGEDDLGVRALDVTVHDACLDA